MKLLAVAQIGAFAWARACNPDHGGSDEEIPEYEEEYEEEDEEEYNEDEEYEDEEEAMYDPAEFNGAWYPIGGQGFYLTITDDTFSAKVYGMLEIDAEWVDVSETISGDVEYLSYSDADLVVTHRSLKDDAGNALSASTGTLVPNIYACETADTYSAMNNDWLICSGASSSLTPHAPLHR